MARSGLCATVALLSILLGGAVQDAGAREQDEGSGVCWDPDVEFPVPCDEDEE